MASEITIPKSSGYHGTVTKWFKAIGDPVRKGESLFEITSAIGSEKIPSTASGVLTSIIRYEGDDVTGGNVLGQIGDFSNSAKPNHNESIISVNESENVSTLNEQDNEEDFEDVSIDELMNYIGPFDLSQALADVQSYYVRETQERFALRQIKDGTPKKHLSPHHQVIRAMPSARVFAKANDISLIDLVNCGVRGCITKRDVARFVEQRRIFEKQQKEKRDADFSEHMASYNNAEPDEISTPVTIDDHVDDNEQPSVLETEKIDRFVSEEKDNPSVSEDSVSSDVPDKNDSKEKRVKISHLAQNIAKKNQIELDNGVNGSGAHGRILKSDLTGQVTDDEAINDVKVPEKGNHKSLDNEDQRIDNGKPTYTLDPSVDLDQSDGKHIGEQLLLNDYLIDDFKSQLSVSDGYRYHAFLEDTEVAVLTKDIDTTFLKKLRKNMNKPFEAETGLRCATTDLWIAAISKAFCDVSTKKEDVNIALLLKNNNYIVTPVIKSVDRIDLKSVVKSRIDYIEGVKCNRYDKSTHLGADLAYFNLHPFEIDSLAFPMTESGCPVLTTGSPKDKAYGLTKKTVVTLSLTVLPKWIPFGKAFIKAIEGYIAEPDLIFK